MKAENAFKLALAVCLAGGLLLGCDGTPTSAPLPTAASPRTNPFIPTLTSTPKPTLTSTSIPFRSPTPTPTPLGGGSGLIAFWNGYYGGIYTMNLDGSNLTLAANGDSPAWSPDGKRIAYSDGQIHVMNADGSEQFRLTNFKALLAYADDPDWSPDGKRIAFDVRVDTFQNDIFVVNADGSHLSRLTTTGGFYPAWSPDGRHIAYSSKRDVLHSAIYIMDPDGSNQIRLTDYSRSDQEPDWSPDGKLIVFCTFVDDARNDLWVMNADGSNVTQLTDERGTSPAWSPDGKRIAYTCRDAALTGHVCVAEYDNYKLFSKQTLPGPENGYFSGFPAWQP